jgi:hypothetical protein
MPVKSAQLESATRTTCASSKHWRPYVRYRSSKIAGMRGIDGTGRFVGIAGTKESSISEFFSVRLF